METQTRVIELDGLKFQFRETGEESAPPLIALHALGQSGASFDAVAATLARKYRVLALDLRGHGGSARPGTYSFELMRDDLRQFANTLGLESFTLLGHSMGGTVSYLFAEAYPDRIVQLIVEDTPPPFPDKQLEIPPEPAQPLPFDYFVVPPIFRQLNDPDPAWWQQLPEISAPTLIVGGGSTSHIPQDKLEEVSKLIPNCELVTVEGAGHNVHSVNLPAFLDAVTRFLDV
ncbi:alpha/beta fold hydrolase [Alicyclobacillus sp. ALC3]|uniref:alpha/beta fold hydrolase n=1 Tax=Alicyclobacillus sp. ALC3 TaxID=2796143 RepID=UPI0027A952C0|nr:alpha/beta hydrolase [Alicyclobacillus sp. ALC3]